MTQKMGRNSIVSTRRGSHGLAFCLWILFPLLNKLLIKGYFGCAIGKAKQSAKTELEKLKLKDMTAKELIKEAAKMYEYLKYNEN